MTQALHHVGDTYTKIGVIFEEEPRHDWEPLGNLLYEYRGILDGFPQIITATKVRKREMGKRSSVMKMKKFCDNSMTNLNLPLAMLLCMVYSHFFVAFFKFSFFLRTNLNQREWACIELYCIDCYLYQYATTVLLICCVPIFFLKLSLLKCGEFEFYLLFTVQNTSVGLVFFLSRFIISMQSYLFNGGYYSWVQFYFHAFAIERSSNGIYGYKYY